MYIFYFDLVTNLCMLRDGEIKDEERSNDSSDFRVIDGCEKWEIYF